MMHFPTIDPVFFRLGPLEFRWYGLMYIIGFTAAYFIVKSRARRAGIPLNKDDLADLIFYSALGVILGGRLGYVLFYNAEFFLANPVRILAVWEGGMSFHGGLTGGLLGGFIFVRRRGLDFLAMADAVIVAAPVGIGLGRIGNFINGELYGRVTSVPWGLVFPGGGIQPRHPSQLYEAILEGPVLFGILWLLGTRRSPDGTLLGAFIALYGTIRCFVEMFREPDAQLGFFWGIFSMGQLLSLPMVLAGLLIIVWAYQGKRGRD